ncbi:MAG: tRNA dihydrouridine synthase DusB [Oscillospiraceae bacterium]|nr:tRNA dihydrouridine synthase DusB [Oscillospiraceae bacterium]
MNLNGLNIDSKAVLAPMAGFCDIVLRKVADDFGAGFTISEMVSARALYYGDEKSKQLMATWDHKGRYGIQLFGFDPVDFEHATKLALECNPDFIDINMGCPAPKIVTNGAGSALMKNTDLAMQIAKTVVDNANGTPVSVKMRKGWDDNCISCVELAKKVESVGVNFITVHGRTRQQMYHPGIDMDAIKSVKQAVNIPVIGNGDIVTPQDAINMMDYTGCDAVMVGREALSRPWIFKQINQALAGITPDDDPTVEERMALLLWHIEKLCEVNGEHLGMKKARGQAALYMKGLRGAAKMRYLTNSLSVFADAENLVKEVLKENGNV